MPMKPAMTLYGAPTGNCLRAAIALEEAGIPYLARPVDLRRGEHLQAPLLALNPLGKLPVLVHELDAVPFVLTQSNAIILYADSLAPGRLAPSAPGAARGRVMERFFYFLTDVIAPSHAGFFLRGATVDGARTALAERALQSLVHAERFAGETEYIAGDAFSMADIAAFTIAAALYQQIPWDALPHLARWYQHVSKRHAVRRALAVFSS
jgi:GST-like protein